MSNIDDKEQDSEQGKWVHTNSNTAGRNTWGGQYCCVLLCRSSSGECIRRDPGCNFAVNQNTKVCSLHFTNKDYISGDPLHSKRHVLKQTAVPSVFPWTAVQHQQSTNTSKLAASVYQC